MPYREKLKIKLKGSKKHRTRDAQKSYEKDVKWARHHLLSDIEEFHAQAKHFLDVTRDTQEDEQSTLMPYEEREKEEEDVFEEGADEDVFEIDEFEWDRSDVESEEGSDGAPYTDPRILPQSTESPRTLHGLSMDCPWNLH